MIINLHPSLLPSFPGLDAIGQAWRRGVKMTGCTVHYVTCEVDGGPIIDQTAVRDRAGGHTGDARGQDPRGRACAAAGGDRAAQRGRLLPKAGKGRADHP